MKPVYRLITAIIISLGLAVGAYYWATGMLDSLYAFRSPLKTNPPAPGDSLGPPATRRLVFILVDALRYDTAQNADLMPTLAGLRAKGASARLHSQTPSYSEPGYSTLLTGAWPYLNDGPAMNKDYADIPTWTQDNLFSAAARAGKKTAVSGYYWFEKLIPQAAVSAKFYTPGEDARADRAVVDAALPWLAEPDAYQLVFIHIDQVDYAGHHEGGPRGPQWAAAASRADQLIAEILAKVDLSQDTVLVTSDHGQIMAGGHGGDEPDILIEPLVLAGRGIRPGQYGELQMVDVAPTVAALLGLNIPASAQGQAQTGMLDLPAQTLTQLPLAEAAQQSGLGQAYQAAIGGAGAVRQIKTGPENIVASWQSAIRDAQSARLQGERWVRGLIAVGGLLLIAGLLYRLRGERAGWMAAGCLTYLAVFNLRYLLIDGRTYSFSSVQSASDLIVYCGITSAIALGFGWLVYMAGSRILRSRPVEAARSTLGLCLGICGALGVMVLYNTVINGPMVTWIIPEAAPFFGGLLALIQILFVGVLSLLFAGLAAITAWAVERRHQAISQAQLRIDKA